MKLSSQLTDDLVLQELGSRLTSIRLERNLTQAGLAEQAGVSKRTIERLEAGAVGTQLSGFIRVCRTLDLLERWDAFLPEASAGPMAQLKSRGQKRKRATGGRKSAAAKTKKWTWGDSE